MGTHLPRRIARGTGARILELLRRGPMTVDQLAASLQLTRTAVQGQLAALQNDGLVEQRGTLRGASKPARTFGVTQQAELLFSRAYIPILTQLVHVLAQRMTTDEFDSIMREVGRTAIGNRRPAGGTLAERVARASSLLNELGGLSEVREEDGLYIIESYGCPLAAATAVYPEACSALESLLSEFAGTRVTKCCDRNDRQRCCFEVERGSGLLTASPSP